VLSSEGFVIPDCFQRHRFFESCDAELIDVKSFDPFSSNSVAPSFFSYMHSPAFTFSSRTSNRRVVQFAKT